MFVLTELQTEHYYEREIGFEELYCLAVPALYKNEMHSQLIL